MSDEIVELNKNIIEKVKEMKDLVEKHNEDQQNLRFELKKSEELLERFRKRCRNLFDSRMSLTEEKSNLNNKLDEEMKNYKEIVATKQRVINGFKNSYDDLKNKLELQIKDNYKQLSLHKTYVLKIKSSFNSQLISLKKQIQYLKRCNEINVSFLFLKKICNFIFDKNFLNKISS
jgi:chromosome segregation ATPase